MHHVGMPSYDKFPDKTVAEVKAVHDAAQAAYKAWQERKRTAQMDFGAHLRAVSQGRIELFFERKPGLGSFWIGATDTDRQPLTAKRNFTILSDWSRKRRTGRERLAHEQARGFRPPEGP